MSKSQGHGHGPRVPPSNGRRVWFVREGEQERRLGTLWTTYDGSVLIREDAAPGLVVLPLASQGTRWGSEERDKA